MSSGPLLGQTAPDFTLRHTFEQQVSLAAECRQHAVLLAFYVFDFGSV